MGTKQKRNSEFDEKKDVSIDSIQTRPLAYNIHTFTEASYIYLFIY